MIDKMKVRDISIILACLQLIAFLIFALFVWVYMFCVVVIWKAPFMAGCLSFFLILAAMDRLRELGE